MGISTILLLSAGAQLIVHGLCELKVGSLCPNWKIFYEFFQLFSFFDPAEARFFFLEEQIPNVYHIKKTPVFCN